ncbi:MAG: hypothetical protein ACQEXC_00425 [Pseudomonadota bacterium]
MLTTWPILTKRLLHSPKLTTEGVTVPPGASGLDSRMTWPFRIAWPPSGQPYQERLAWKTEIMTTRSGREFRKARRTVPRASIEFAAILHGEELRRFNTLMWGRQPRLWVLPDIDRSVTLGTALPEGADALVIENSPYWMQPGTEVVLSHGGEAERLEIGAVAGDINYFTGVTSREWPPGTLIAAGRIGTLSQSLGTQRLTNMTAVVDNIQVDVLPLSEVPRQPAPPALEHEGREVFLRRPNWAEQVQVDTAHPVEVLDYDVGPVARYVHIPFGHETRSAVYLSATREAVGELRDFFWRMRGQQGEFWMPTWEPDMVMVADTPAGGDTIEVAGVDIARWFGGSATHRVIFIKTTGGDLLIRGVTGLIETGEGTTQVTLDAALPDGLAPEGVVMIGWLLLHRLASDSLVIEWLTDRVANVQLNMRTLEALLEEVL